MSKLFEDVLGELDQIVKEEYGRTYALSLLEASNDEDDAISTPISRAASFPARAIRFRKAKSVMNKYARKILAKTDKIIARFEREIDKSVPQIAQRGEDLQKELNAAKKSGDEIGARAIVNQQKKFTEDVKKNQDERVNTLNQTVENLINTYTTAIHKRIDEPGYVLKVELSEKGKADLKFMWEELVAAIKQKSYEKLVKIINNKNIKGLESLVARLQIEIEEAEDKRYQSRRSSRSLRSSEEDYSGKGAEGSSEKEAKTADGYKGLKKYLDENLPDGLLDENDSYKYEESAGKVLKVYIESDDKSEKITAVFYNEDDDLEQADPIREEEIDSEIKANELIDAVKQGETGDEYQREDKKAYNYTETLFNHMETLFKTRTKALKDIFGSVFYDEFNDKKIIREFSRYVVGEIMTEPSEYPRQEKILANQSITDRQLVNLFLKRFKNDFAKYEKSNESFLSLSTYKKLNS
jgi:hypothetical protein